MKKLQILLAAAVLTSMIGVSAVVGQTPPCPEPGIISTPPCSGQAASEGDIDEPNASTTTSGQMDTPSSADSYITVAVSVFESALLLF